MRSLFHFEPKHAPLLGRKRFLNRILKNLLASTAILCLFLGAGVLGYHTTCSLGWLDSLLNASMILAGMGPVDAVTTAAGKWFASLYALFSGVVFISVMGIALAPVVHRIFHRFHMGDALEENQGEAA